MKKVVLTSDFITEDIYCQGRNSNAFLVQLKSGQTASTEKLGTFQDVPGSGGYTYNPNDYAQFSAENDCLLLIFGTWIETTGTLIETVDAFDISEKLKPLLMSHLSTNKEIIMIQF